MNKQYFAKGRGFIAKTSDCLVCMHFISTVLLDGGTVHPGG